MSTPDADGVEMLEVEKCSILFKSVQKAAILTQKAGSGGRLWRQKCSILFKGVQRPRGGQVDPPVWKTGVTAAGYMGPVTICVHSNTYLSPLKRGDAIKKTAGEYS